MVLTIMTRFIVGLLLLGIGIVIVGYMYLNVIEIKWLLNMMVNVVITALGGILMYVGLWCWFGDDD